MGLKAKIEVVVSQELRSKIKAMKDGTGGTWRDLARSIDGWDWSHTMLCDIQRGRQKFVNVDVYRVMGVSPPVIPITLENVNLLQVSESALSHFLARARVQVCAVAGCEERYYKIGNTKYCPAHSWTTREGRRYWRSWTKGVETE